MKYMETFIKRRFVFRSLHLASVLSVLSMVTLNIAFAQNGEALPNYKPVNHLTGSIRIFGSELGGMVRVWEEGFRKFQPDVSFEDQFPSSDGAEGGLIAGVADIGTSGREPVLTEYLSFNETFKYDLQTVSVATGAYDLKGRT